MKHEYKGKTSALLDVAREAGISEEDFKNHVQASFGVLAHQEMSESDLDSLNFEYRFDGQAVVVVAKRKLAGMDTSQITPLARLAIENGVGGAEFHDMVIMSLGEMLAYLFIEHGKQTSEYTVQFHDKLIKIQAEVCDIQPGSKTPQ